MDGSSSETDTTSRRGGKKKQQRNMTMELTTILTVDQWAQFEKELYDCFHMNCAVLTASGSAVTGRPNWCNDLCEKIKTNENSRTAICAAGNQFFMAHAKKTALPYIGECDAGLLKITVPIFAKEKFIGVAGGCGLLPQGGEVDLFMVSRSSGMDENEIVERCKNLETMTMGQAERMAEFIQQRIDYLMKGTFDYNVRTPPGWPVLHWIEGILRSATF